ncbi:MAG: phosphoadenosine phosphosulfate reductase family protein, partial [Euryarchaeota archaeon]|nr:phosphoadenosine phosphosulfate reductase family protein [Euryarchaeota archaeon]
MGLRADESHDRKLNFLTRGFVYKKADGLTAAQPIADWSAKDVWAYITANGLPYNPIYDKTRFEERNKLRVAPFGLGGWHVSLGSYVFMKYYYPGLWNRFCEKNPLARKYI